MDETRQMGRRVSEPEPILRHKAGVRQPAAPHDPVFRAVFDTAPSAMIFTRLDTGVCVDVNEGFCRLSGFDRDDLIGRTSSELGLWVNPADREELLRRLDHEGVSVEIESQFRVKSGEVRRGWMVARRIEFAGIAYLVTVTRDVEDERQTEDRLHRTQRALRATSCCNRSLIHAEDETTLLQAICSCITKEAGYRFAWVGIVDRGTGDVVPVAWAGHEDGYLSEARISVSECAQHVTPACMAIKENRVAVCRSIEECEAFAAWKEAAQRRGYRAAISLPLQIDGATAGSLNIYSTTELSFMDEETELLQELTDDLSYGLSALRARARHEDSEKQRLLSQRKFQSVFSQSSEGIALVDDAGTLLDWNRAMETLTGITHADIVQHPIEAFLNLATPCTPESAGSQVEIGYRIRRWLSGREFVGSFEPVEVDIRRPDGETKCLRISLFPVTTEEDRLWGCICTDITVERDAVRRAQKGMDGSIEAMARVTEMRDPYTSGHQLQVERLSRRIAVELGLPEETCDALRVASSLHDIGKIAVPAEILAKPSALEEHEWGLIRRHPDVGFELLAPIDFPWPIAEIVRQHHERLDGSGYPRGLRGDAIMIEARIIGVADVVEAMSAHRPYRPSLGIDAAIREIRKGRGERYDSQVVDACVRVLQRGFSEDDD